MRWLLPLFFATLAALGSVGLVRAWGYNHQADSGALPSIRFAVDLRVSRFKVDLRSQRPNLPSFSESVPMEASLPEPVVEEESSAIVIAPPKPRIVANPTWIKVPSKINVPVVEAGRGPDNAPEVPNVRPADNFKQFGIREGSAGFFNESGKPGSGKNGFYLAHLSTRNSNFGHPFSRLNEVTEKDKVYVTNADGQVFAYQVFMRIQRPSSDEEFLGLAFSDPVLMAQEVWRSRKINPIPLEEEELVVLFTCAGEFNYTKGEYKDRLVVIARLID